MSKVNIIIPIYDEAGSLVQAYKEMASSLTSSKGDDNFELVFVNDGSTDNTIDELKKIMELSQHGQISVKCISSHKNLGKTNALTAGILLSKGEYIVFMDGDLQDDPSYINSFLKKLKNEELDIVCGNRVNRYSKNPIKKISSQLASYLVGLLVEQKVNDINCSMKAMKREVAEKLDLKSDYHRYIPLLAIMKGYLYDEIEIVQRNRLHGESKYGTFGLIRFSKSFFDYLSIWFILKFGENPFGLFGKSGFLLFSLGTAVLLYLSVRWFFGFYILGRPLFFLGILLVNTGINFVALGLLGELIVSNKDTKESLSARFYKAL